MSEKRIVAVVGATGHQGGGLARAILDDPRRTFALRALTRDPSSEAARALARRGAEVVAFDVGDPRSVARAFEGAHAAFCVTFFWAHLSPERELADATRMAHAAKEAGLAHVVWSTLEDTRRFVPLDDPRMPTLMGKYKVPHFDAKGEADQVFRRLGVPTTFLLTSFYWDNFADFPGMAPQRGPDGRLVLALPMGEAKLPGIAAEDIGRCAHAILQGGAEYVGRTVGVAGEHLTGAEMAAVFTRTLGEEVRYVDVPPDVYRGLGFPGADDLGNMFQFKRDFEEAFCGARSVAFSRRLDPELVRFEEWLARNRSRLQIQPATARR